MDSGTSNLLGAGPGEQYLLSNLMIDLTDERQLRLRLLRLQLRGLLHGPTAVIRGLKQGPTPPPLTFFNSPAVSPFFDSGRSLIWVRFFVRVSMGFLGMIELLSSVSCLRGSWLQTRRAASLLTKSMTNALASPTTLEASVAGFKTRIDTRNVWFATRADGGDTRFRARSGDPAFNFFHLVGGQTVLRPRQIFDLGAFLCLGLGHYE